MSDSEERETEKTKITLMDLLTEMKECAGGASFRG